jgi:hypothetical protein
VPTTSSPTHLPTGRIENGVWNIVVTPGTSDTFLGATWYSNYQCLVVGYVDGGGVVLKTSNRGSNWSRKLFHILRPLLSIATFTNETLGGTFFLTTTDGPNGGEVFLILENTLKTCTLSPEILCW